jgi:hypothetical protein
MDTRNTWKVYFLKFRLRYLYYQKPFLPSSITIIYKIPELGSSIKIDILPQSGHLHINNDFLPEFGYLSLTNTPAISLEEHLLNTLNASTLGILPNIDIFNLNLNDSNNSNDNYDDKNSKNNSPSHVAANLGNIMNSPNSNTNSKYLRRTADPQIKKVREPIIKKETEYILPVLLSPVLGGQRIQMKDNVNNNNSGKFINSNNNSNRNSPILSSLQGYSSGDDSVSSSDFRKRNNSPPLSGSKKPMKKKELVYIPSLYSLKLEDRANSPKDCTNNLVTATNIQLVFEDQTHLNYVTQRKKQNNSEEGILK